MTDRRPNLRKIQPQKAEELMNLFDSVAEEPLGDHLNDDQFIDYVTENLSEGKILEIDLHLQTCEECVSRMEHLATNSIAWIGDKGMNRLHELRQRVLRNMSEQNVLRSSILETLALYIRSLLLGENLILGIVQA